MDHHAVVRGKLTPESLAGATPEEFVNHLAEWTRRTAQQEYRSIVHVATVASPYGGMEENTEHRMSFTIPYDEVARSRKLRSALRALERFAMNEIVRHAGLPVRAAMVPTEHGDVTRDGSVVLYEVEGHYEKHHDSDGLAPGNRCWTFLAYLHAPANASGGLEFPNARFACETGTWLLWNNQVGGKTCDDAEHRALPVLPEGLGDARCFYARGNGPSGLQEVHAHKVALNLWFDEASARGR